MRAEPQEGHAGFSSADRTRISETLPQAAQAKSNKGMVPSWTAGGGRQSQGSCALRRDGPGRSIGRMSLAARIRLAESRGLPRPHATTLARLRTPRAVQDWLCRLPQNFEPDGDTARSVRATMDAGCAHCIEGAMVAAFALWLQGHPPLLLDFCAHRDMDHVIAPFRVGGKWGAVSKTNYACLRWRDPVYRSVRELAMSYFHEYAKGPRKTLRSYSVPFDLRKMGDDGWVAGEGNRWDVTVRITEIRHMPVVTEREARALRPRDKVEVATDLITAFPIPAWKRRRL